VVVVEPSAEKQPLMRLEILTWAIAQQTMMYPLVVATQQLALVQRSL
jgi:hypothetical protein